MGTAIPPALAQGDGDPGHPVPGGPCAFCGASTGEDDWCPGCKAFVCTRCDQRPQLAEVYAPRHRRSLHGALERRDLMREVFHGQAALRDGRVQDAAAALNTIEALLRGA